MNLAQIARKSRNHTFRDPQGTFRLGDRCPRPTRAGRTNGLTTTLARHGRRPLGAPATGEAPLVAVATSFPRPSDQVRSSPCSYGPYDKPRRGSVIAGTIERRVGHQVPSCLVAPLRRQGGWGAGTDQPATWHGASRCVDRTPDARSSVTRCWPHPCGDDSLTLETPLTHNESHF